jgi:hypothetical protein
MMATAMEGALGAAEETELTQDQVIARWAECKIDVCYFTRRYSRIYNATEQAWLPFTLWSTQATTLQQMEAERLLVMLKARQLGISWLCLAYALWLLIFQAPSTVLLFSLREAEAIELLTRLKEMHRRLPLWLQARKIERENDTRLLLSTGSQALAFSTKGGRSYTGTLALVDEADFVPDLSSFLNGVKPTIDAGGKLFLVSTSDKKRPVSTFKNVFRAALAGVGDYRAIFLPWHARPGRTASWHDKTKAEMFAQRGTNDDFYAEYPATAEEALAPEQLDRRIPFDWLKEVIDELPPQRDLAAPAIPGLTIYVPAQMGRHYIVGADPAEGNPNSDDSAATVLDVDSWEEVANMVGKFEPSVFAAFIDVLAGYYNSADCLPERNNHGHTVIRALKEKGRTRVLNGYDDKLGWLSNIKGKPLLYDALAEAVRDGICKVRSPETASQLASIEASTLRAPQGLHDDRADSFALAVAALVYGHSNGQGSTAVPPADPLAGIDQDRW